MTQTMDETRARLHAAVLTCTYGPGPGPAQGRALWPDYAHEWSDLVEHVASGNFRRAASAPRFQPTPEQIDDMLVALAWLEARNGAKKLDGYEWELLRLRAYQEWRQAEGGPRASWQAIADIMRETESVTRSDEWWRVHHRGIIRRAHAEAQRCGDREKRFGGLAKNGHSRANVARRVRAA